MHNTQGNNYSHTQGKNYRYTHGDRVTHRVVISIYITVTHREQSHTG